MITEDQSGIVTFLSSPAAHGGLPVERIDTHASMVFLAGERAWKLKRAVRYDYLDFSTVERRKAMCEAEVRLNRPAAPGIYRGVQAVTRQADGSLSVGGSGAPVDWLVEMTRFDQEQLFDRLAARGALPVDVMRPLAAAIARFHAQAARRYDRGGAAGMRWVVDGNALGFAEQGAGVLDADACRALTRDAGVEIDRHTALLDARREAGFVRHCHGDLHLRNIVLLDGRPTLFDGVEFNDDIACIDVFYDLAFLLMDLWRRRLPRHANAVWNGYLFDTGDAGAVALLPLFLSCRAAVRAKTSATAAALEPRARQRSELEGASREYLTRAQQLLAPAPPCVIAVGGFSGSGKSTLARHLAPHVGPVPGAVIVRSDEIRKRLCGADPLQPLGSDGYRAEVTRRVYAAISERTSAIIRAGHAVIADAVYAHAPDRIAIERIAADAGVPFCGMWLEAPEPLLVERVLRRHGDASDADAAVVRRQVAENTGPVEWPHIDASPSAGETTQAAMTLLRARLSGAVVGVRGEAA